MTWFNIINNKNDVLDIDITELSWNPEDINPNTNSKYGPYGIIRTIPLTGITLDVSNYYFTAMRFNNKKVICGEDFINISSTKDFVIDISSLNTDNNLILIEGDYTFKNYDTNESDAKECTPLNTIPKNTSTSVNYNPVAYGQFKTATSGTLAAPGSTTTVTPFSFSMRLMPILSDDKYIFDYSYLLPKAPTDNNSISSTSPGRIWQGGNIGYAMPFYTQGGNFWYNLANFTGGAKEYWNTANTSAKKTLSLSTTTLTLSCFQPSIINSRFRDISNTKNYTLPLRNPDTHSFSVLFNDLFHNINLSSLNPGYISFNINCSKRVKTATTTIPLTKTDSGQFDQHLQISRNPSIANGDYSNIIERTYLKIIRIKKRI